MIQYWKVVKSYLKICFYSHISSKLEFVVMIIRVNISYPSSRRGLQVIRWFVQFSLFQFISQFTLASTLNTVFSCEYIFKVATDRGHYLRSGSCPRQSPWQTWPYSQQDEASVLRPRQCCSFKQTFNIAQAGFKCRIFWYNNSSNNNDISDKGKNIGNNVVVTRFLLHTLNAMGSFYGKLSCREVLKVPGCVLGVHWHRGYGECHNDLMHLTYLVVSVACRILAHSSDRWEVRWQITMHVNTCSKRRSPWQINRWVVQYLGVALIILCWDFNWYSWRV